MIGQFSLNFLEIVVDIKSRTKFMIGKGAEFVEAHNVKDEIHL